MVPFIFQVDFSTAVRPPKLDRSSAVPLAIRLINLAPPDLSPGVRRALRDLREAAVDVQTVLKARHRADAVSLRPLDVAFDNAWGALHGRLTSAARLPHESAPLAKRAGELLDALFPDGLAFVLTDYETEWNEGEVRLGRIAEEGMERELVEIVGRLYLDHVRSAQTALGDALGVGREARRAPAPTGLQDSLTALGQRISSYVRMLSAEVDQSDEASVKRFLDAIAPLDAHRATRGQSGSDAAAEPSAPPSDAPIPPVPADPVAPAA